jgi:hypothetical protein
MFDYIGKCTVAYSTLTVDISEEGRKFYNICTCCFFQTDFGFFSLYIFLHALQLLIECCRKGFFSKERCISFVPFYVMKSV